jgi:putative spermidine/putrescine transport system substrate-binding protein
LSRPQPGSGLNRRRLGACALLALPAVITRPAQAARSVTFAGYGDWFQTAFDRSILGPFRKAHRDIAVFYYPVGNSFQGLTMLRDQRARPAADIVLLETGMAAQAHTEGLLDPLDPAALPVMKDLIPQAIRPGLAGPALMLNSLAIGYNTDMIGSAGKPPVPRSWPGLWDPGYGRRIALQTPPDPLGLAITAMAAALFGDGNPKTSLDIAMTALSQLAPRVALWDPLPDVYTAIAMGDAGIGPCWNARAQFQAGQTPGRLAATIPEEGSPYLTTTINLVKASPQSEAAKTLIAWLLAPEAQRLLAQTMAFAPVNTKADLPPAVLARAGATPAMAARRMEMDWVSIAAMRDQITAVWRQRLQADQ